MSLVAKATMVAAAGALPFLVAACSPSSSSSAPPSGASGSVSATAESSASSPSGSASGGPAGDSPQLVSEASANFKAASSMHVAGTMGAPGSSAKLDLTIAPGKCEGTITTSAGPLTVIQIGSTEWIGAGGTGEYLKMKAGDSQYQGVTGYCSIATIAQAFGGAGAGLVKGPVSEVNGHRAVRFSLYGTPSESVYVSDTGTPEFLRADLPDLRMNFSGYNAPVSISAPPASEVISG